MKRFTQTFIAFALIIAMTAAGILAPVNAQAAEIASGTCGENLTWVLDDSGTLTISGTGAMTASPWSDHQSTVNTIIIEEGVTSIVDYAFQYFTNLTSVTIPDSMETLGACAFLQCSSLVSVVIPDGITVIPTNVFGNCTSLTSVTIPESVTTISAFAFGGCRSLVAVDIPQSVTELGHGAFSRCSSLKSIVIPDGVTLIHMWTFQDCTALESVILPDSLQKIDPESFIRCSSLRQIVIPDSVTYIDTVAFRDCSSLATVYLPVSLENLGLNAFSNCSAMETVYYGGNEAQREAIDAYDGNEDLFNTQWVYNYRNLKILTQPRSVAVVDGEMATVTVEAQGNGLRYRWYFKNPGDSGYTYTSSFRGNSYRVEMSGTRNGRQVLCRVYDQYGNVVQTNAVKLSMCNEALGIVAQPQSVTVAEGVMATVTVTAKGDGLSYRWYYKDAGASAYTYTASYTTNTYKVPMNAARDGRQLLCRIYDRYGNVVQTEVVTLSMQKPVQIITQPRSVTVAEGQMATVTVEAQGDGLTYRWYFKNPGASTYTYTSTFTGNTYRAAMNAARNGRQLLCRVYDRYGNVVQTNTVILRMR